MARKKIFSLGFDFPGNTAESISLLSDRSLLDADIIVFKPGFAELGYYGTYKAKPSLSESPSFQLREQIRHWRAELLAAFEAGKTIIVYLARPEDVYVQTGRKEHSGTGRNRQTTNIVELVSSYDALPFSIKVEARSGTQVAAVGDLGVFAPYWEEFGSASPYCATIEGKFTDVLLKTQSGNRIVAASIRNKTGALILLPPISYDVDAFTAFDEESATDFWTDDAVSFGHFLAATTANMATAIAADSEITPPPQWTQAVQFRLAEEDTLEAQITLKADEIQAIVDAKRTLEHRLEETGRLRRLLYEKGKPLEAAILDALRIIGFTADPFENGDSEFDAVFVSAEGRFLGEAEGKDNRSINIQKITQLERNLQEDFARDEVFDYAKGVLFGNPHRLTPPAERHDAFTTKCITAAERLRIALVRTCDLFEPARYLQSNDDPDFAASCRKAIFDASGKLVMFPTPPDSVDKEEASLKEEVKRGSETSAARNETAS